MYETKKETKDKHQGVPGIQKRIPAAIRRLHKHQSAVNRKKQKDGRFHSRRFTSSLRRSAKLKPQYFESGSPFDTGFFNRLTALIQDIETRKDAITHHQLRYLEKSTQHLQFGEFLNKLDEYIQLPGFSDLPLIEISDDGLMEEISVSEEPVLRDIERWFEKEHDIDVHIVYNDYYNIFGLTLQYIDEDDLPPFYVINGEDGDEFYNKTGSPLYYLFLLDWLNYGLYSGEYIFYDLDHIESWCEELVENEEAEIPSYEGEDLITARGNLEDLKKATGRIRRKVQYTWNRRSQIQESFKMDFNYDYLISKLQRIRREDPGSNALSNEFQLFITMLKDLKKMKQKFLDQNLSAWAFPSLYIRIGSNDIMDYLTGPDGVSYDEVYSHFEGGRICNDDLTINFNGKNYLTPEWLEEKRTQINELKKKGYSQKVDMSFVAATIREVDLNKNLHYAIKKITERYFSPDIYRRCIGSDWNSGWKGKRFQDILAKPSFLRFYKEAAKWAEKGKEKD